MSDRPGRILGICLSHAPGRALSYYERLLGWSCADDAFRLRAHVVATVAPQEEIPPQWYPAIEVGDLGAALSAARARGADVLRQGEAGALVSDHEGSASLLCRSDSPLAILLRTDPYLPSRRDASRLSWLQLNVCDPDAALGFYRDVLGWAGGPSDNDRYTYARFLREGAPHAGLLTIDHRSGPIVPGWQAYVHVPGLAGLPDGIPAAGGSVLVAPTEIVAGRFAVGRDPDGVVLAFDDMHRSPAG